MPLAIIKNVYLGYYQNHQIFLYKSPYLKSSTAMSLNFFKSKSNLLHMGSKSNIIKTKVQYYFST